MALMAAIEDYVARIEEACGAEKDIIVTLKYEKKQEALANILKKAKLKNNISGVIFDLTFENIPFRAYSNGKIIFHNLRGKEELNRILGTLLL